MTAQTLQKHLESLQQQVAARNAFIVKGKITRLVGLTLEAVGVEGCIGSLCEVTTKQQKVILAEVVGFNENKAYLMPIGQTFGITPGAIVTPLDKTLQIPVGNNLLGRVISGTGEVLDGHGDLKTHQYASLHARPINPLLRRPINKPLDVGIRAINALHTLGEGQRMGLFAGTGVGKSVLLGMITKMTQADIVVVGLIGERGREVNEFISQTLGAKGMQRAVVVAEPADSPPLRRIYAASAATCVAEYFRDQGKKVLLIMDSLTRVAHAMREVGFAIGEPAAFGGYPPSVFSKIPKLIERAGNTQEENGSITAIYTVLAEGDNQQNPLVDAARGILDGHIVLSRDLAEMSVFPAIDVLGSVSRVMAHITDSTLQANAHRFKKYYSIYKKNEDLIKIGAYVQGQDKQLDKAYKLIDELTDFITQSQTEQVTFAKAQEKLANLMDKFNEPA